MKILHISDAHLGFSQYMLRQRREDFTKVLLNSVIDSIKSGVDVVLFSGDIFNNKRPSWKSISDFGNIIDVLNRNGKKIFAITGNHCHTAEYSWIDYYNLNKADIDGLDIRRVNWTQNPMSRVDEFGKCNPNKFNILMMHHGTTNYYGVITQDDIDKIKGFGYNYVALGHIHKPYIVDDLLFNPGSLEYTSSDLWGDPGGYFIIDVIDENKFKYEHVVTPHRESIKYKINLKKAKIKTDKQLLHKIKSSNVKIPKDSMIEVILYGGNVHPSVIDSTEKIIKNGSLRTKIRHIPVIDEKNISNVENISIDSAFTTVFGADAAAIKKIVTASDEPDEVIKLL